MRLFRALATLVLLLLSALPLLAQRHPNIELGFNPDRLYHFGDLDSVNLYNGNLVLRLPIGATYHANGGFNYSLTLVYNSKVWDLRRQEESAGVFYSYATPNQRSNAGVGWRLSLGRLLPPDDPTAFSPGNDSGRWIYESPTGSEHVFQSLPFGSWDNNATVMVSADQSHLRMVRVSSTERHVELSNGEVHKFRYLRGRWRLREMVDRFGNFLKINITPQWKSTQIQDGREERWILTDSIGRQHTINLMESESVTTNALEMNDTVDHGQIVDSVVLATIGGSATYDFQYTAEAVYWGCGHQPSPYADSGLRGSQVMLPMLDKIILPDGTSFDFSYAATGAAGTCSQGAIYAVTLPTSGMISYDYQDYPRAESICSAAWNGRNAGVKSKTTPDGRWDYVLSSAMAHELTQEESQAARDSCPGDPFAATIYPPRRWARTTVLSPPVKFGTADRRVRTDHYHYTWPFDSPVPDPFLQSGLSLNLADPLTTAAPPFWDTSRVCGTPGQPDSCVSEAADVSAADNEGTDRRLLSTRLFEGCSNDGTGACATGQVLRSNYLRFISLPAGAGRGQYPMESSRTLFHDDTGCSGSACWLQTTLSDSNGAGYFKTSTTTTNFPEGGGFSTFTGYADWTDASRLSAAVWLPDVFSLKKRTEGGRTATTDYCFGSDGFLNGTRVRNGLAWGVNDVLTKFANDGKGNVADTRTFGGDDQAIPTSDVCPGMASTVPRYLNKNTYSNGLLAKSEYCAPALPGAACVPVLTSLDIDIDASGLPTKSRDAAGLETIYSYDSIGRLSSVQPPGAASSSYAYDAATSTAFASVTETVLAGATTLTTTKYEFDRFGRLKRVSKSLPSGYGVVESEFDGLGRKTRVSQPVHQSSLPSSASAVLGQSWTTTRFDALSRPVSTTQPDGSVATTTYTGDRRQQRSSSVATSTTAESQATSTAHYDAQQRITRVDENAAGTSYSLPAGGLTTTTYAYDVSGKLKSVAMNDGSVVQSRSFNYDLRGFLTDESHPENGTTSYSEYDARGHAARVTNGGRTVAADFDEAERVTQVSEVVSGTLKPLKDFAFGTANAGSDYRKGKLVSAVRHQELTSAGNIDVTETYEYAHPSGQLSGRTTLVERVDGGTRTQIQRFHYGVSEYDPLGNPRVITMPTCALNGCNVTNGLTNLTFARTAGFLTSVQNFGSLTYHPSGMVETVTHPSAPAATDTYAAIHGLPRPASIMFSGGTCAAPTGSLITAPASVCPSSANLSASVAARTGITHTWQITGGTITSASTGDSITFQAGTGSNVTLTVTATNMCGSGTNTSKTVPISSAISASTITAPTAVCANSAGHSASVPARSGVTHSWQISGGSITSSSTGESITFSAAGSGTITLTVTAASSCGSASSSKQVSVLSGPAATLSGSTTIVRGSGASASLTVNVSGDVPFRLEWEDGRVDENAGYSLTRQVTPTQTTTYRLTAVRSNITSCAGTTSGQAVVTVIPVAPSWVQATTQQNRDVAVTWASVSDATSYRVERTTVVGGSASMSTTIQGTSFNDVLPPSSTAAAYVYYVRAIDGAGGMSNRGPFDVAVGATNLWTNAFGVDPPIIRGVDIQDLRNAIDAYRAAFAVPPAFAGSTAPAGYVSASHLTALVTALNAARPTSFSYANVPAPAIGGPILRAHVQQLRDALR